MREFCGFDVFYEVFRSRSVKRELVVNEEEDAAALTSDVLIVVVSLYVICVAR